MSTKYKKEMMDFLTVKEISQRLKLHTQTIYKLVEKNRIPHIKKKGIGIRFNPVDIEKWMNKDKTSILDIPILIYHNQPVNETNRSENMAKRVRTPIGSVYQRLTKDGRIRWYLDCRFNGERVRKVCKYAITREEALEELIMEISNAHSRKLGIEKQKRITFREFSELYMTNYAKVNKRSWKIDFYYMKAYFNHFKDIFLDEITTFDVESLKAELSKKIAPPTVNRYLAVLKRMFNLAIEWGYTKENPVRKVKLFSVRERVKERILTPEEELKLFSKSSEHLRPIIVMALNTGMRRNEILTLKWQDVDLKNRIIKVKNTKSGKGREIPINQILHEELIGLRLRNGLTPYVFTNPAGEPIKSIRTAFEGALRRAEIKGLRFHDLRHTFATRLIQNGKDIETVRRLLGHHSITMTQRYTHTHMDVMRKAVESLSPWTQLGHMEGESFGNAFQKAN